jgi:hypothetical protein
VSTADIYWDGDDISLAVWSAIGGTDITLDEQPEDVIERLRRNGYDWTRAAEELGIHPGMRRELAIASAWAGIGRVAMRRRDNAVRACVNRGASERSVATATGLAHTSIGRIIGRGDSPRGRW